MIVTDWAHNKQFMSDGETALFIPVHNVPALYDKMKKCIEGCYDIGKMALKCQQNAETYDVNKVITKELLKKLNFSINDECPKTIYYPKIIKTNIYD